MIIFSQYQNGGSRYSRDSDSIKNSDQFRIKPHSIFKKLLIIFDEANFTENMENAKNGEKFWNVIKSSKI